MYFEELFEFPLEDFEISISGQFDTSGSSGGKLRLGDMYSGTEVDTKGLTAGSVPVKYYQNGQLNLKPPFYYFDLGANRWITYAPNTAKTLGNFLGDVVNEASSLEKLFPSSNPRVNKDWVIQQAINRARGSKNGAEESSMLSRVGPANSKAPLPFDPFWFTQLGVDLLHNYTELAKFHSLGLSAYKPPSQIVKTATPAPVITSMPTTTTQPLAEFWSTPLGKSIASDPKALARLKEIGAEAFIKELQDLKAAGFTSATPAPVVATPKPVDPTPTPKQDLAPFWSTPLGQSIASNPAAMARLKEVGAEQYIAELQQAKASGVDPFWGTELGKHLASDPNEMAKMLANKEAYFAGIQQLAPVVSGFKDMAAFAGCNIELSQIKAYLEQAALQRQATNEHNVIMNEDKFRNTTLSSLGRILSTLTNQGYALPQAINMVKGACGMGN